ncbi:hypothetical protein BAUCODRAFT_33139 [Baudoinia panamericana UAMH 10762]|uniref:Ubiquitin-like domain-containing protein n=1 Tax=Baudoinia panamericana (strain UAMH 10762) TaxID=717646 RepID=M2N0F8_BAUPA|nr:uncharacterized protein BAUCODRAFT_33139 [Baudoinia panamericana UAMH 10762]EMC97423.1 hypothetical protein BAUCODRAFT_33139 [Baudoinia panamericana UAMH 10762]
MSEVTFAKSFLATLDKKPIKLPADHVSDPRKYPAQSPYTLPRPTHPFPRKTVPAATQEAKQKTVTATLKPMRGGETVTLADLTLQSTIHDIKTQYAQQSSQPQDKIKLLLNKKPAADLKTLQELGVAGETVELSVMIMGAGAATPTAATTPAVEKSEPVAPSTAEPPAVDKMDVDEKTPAPSSEKAQAEAEAKPEAQANTAHQILASEEFWTDLKGFLSQRLRDDQEAGTLVQVFREAHAKQ